MKTDRLEARLDALQAALVGIAAALSPDRARLAQRVFLAGVADLEDNHDRDHAADAALASVVTAMLAALDPAAKAPETTGNCYSVPQ